MAFPFMAVAGTALQGLSMLQGAQASKQQQKQLRAQGEYQAAVLRNQAAFARFQAEDAIKRGRFAEEQQRTQTAQMIGRQRSQMAAAGVLVDSGSAGDMTIETAMFGELDAQVIRFNAEREALLFEMDAVNMEADAEMARLGFMGQAAAERTRATSQLLASAGNIASRWNQFAPSGGGSAGGISGNPAGIAAMDRLF